MEIRKISNTTIELSGVDINSKAEIEQILKACHKIKHLYLEGYPCGRKTRKKNNLKLKKWAKCPEICFVYLVTPLGDGLIIRVLVSDLVSLKKRYTDDEINYFASMYIQNVADEITKEIPHLPN